MSKTKKGDEEKKSAKTVKPVVETKTVKDEDADNFLEEETVASVEQEKEIEKKTTETPEPANVSAQLLEEFRKMQERLDRQADEIKQLKSQQVATSFDEDESEVSMDTINDYLEEPAVFFAFSTRWSLYGDKRYGKTILPPDNEPYQFEKAHRWQKKNSTGNRGTEIISVCQVLVRSKRRADWLRKHSQFNIKFFENLQSAASVDTYLAEKMAWANSVVSNMNDYQVIERAKRFNLPVNPDIMVMRRTVIEKMANDAINLERGKKVQDAVKAKNRVVEEKTVDQSRLSQLAKDTASE